jgi:hypothetical protein
MSRTVYVDAEVDMCEINKRDLAEELVERLGKVEALNLVNSVKEERRGVALIPEDDEAKFLRLRVADALAELDRGRVEEAMHELRMIAADQTSIVQWQAIKDGKHPFLSLRKALDS